MPLCDSCLVDEGDRSIARLHFLSGLDCRLDAGPCTNTSSFPSAFRPVGSKTWFAVGSFAYHSSVLFLIFLFTFSSITLFARRFTQRNPTYTIALLICTMGRTVFFFNVNIGYGGREGIMVWERERPSLPLDDTLMIMAFGGFLNIEPLRFRALFHKTLLFSRLSLVFSVVPALLF